MASSVLPPLHLHNALPGQVSPVQARPCPLVSGVGMRSAESTQEELFGRSCSSGAATAQYTADLVRRRTVELADQRPREATDGLVGRGVCDGIVTNLFSDYVAFVNWNACDFDRVSFRHRLESTCA